MLNVTLAVSGAVTISVGGAPWLDAPAPVAFMHHANWYSSDCNDLPSADFCLQPDHAGPVVEKGRDMLGDFIETSLAWTSATRVVRKTEEALVEMESEPPLLVSGVREYLSMPDVAVLTQRFPQGLVPGVGWPRNDDNDDNDEEMGGTSRDVASSFPTIAYGLRHFHVIMYEGVQLQNTRVFSWKTGTNFSSNDARPDGSASKAPDPYGEAMPLVLIDDDPNTDALQPATLVLSPLHDFFTSHQGISSRMRGRLSFGLKGSLDAAPPNHTYATLLVASQDGVRSAMARWGRVLREANTSPNFSKASTATNSVSEIAASDPSLSFLSYYTDNGAFYYYQTANGTGFCAPPNTTPCPKNSPPTPHDGSGYQQTLDLLSTHWSHGVHLPVHAVQYDSWWYYKGNASGIVLWEPMPSMLGGPVSQNADPSTWYRTPSNAPTVLHSRWFQSDNMYLLGVAPGQPHPSSSPWRWLVDNSTGVAAPVDVRFFEHIFKRSQAGLGMVTYLQDFLAHTYETVGALSRDLGAAKSWLEAMDEAAARCNVTIQFCMALPRHILQAATLPQVTHARASHDYGQSRWGDSEQWSPLGLTAMLYFALGVLPFKDNFWSERNNPGNHWSNTTAEAMEVDAELQAVVSALSGGPVAPSDEIGRMNRTRIMRTCREDGRLLKPLTPAMQLDSSFVRLSRRGGCRDKGGVLGIESAWGALMRAAQGASDATSPLHHLLLFANLTDGNDDYMVTVAELHTIESEWNNGLVPSTEASSLPSTYLAQEFYTQKTLPVDAKRPLIVQQQTLGGRQCDGLDLDYYCVPFELWSLAPVFHSENVGLGWALLGEVDKYVAVSEQRFRGWQAGASGFSVGVIGAPGETVRVRVARVDAGNNVQDIVEVNCAALPTRLECSSAASSSASSSCTCDAAHVSTDAKPTGAHWKSNRPPHIIHIMGDDVGYDNLGIFNGGKTFTPNLDALIGSDGIRLSNFHTFKICAPSRASTMTGRYPFNAGFYGDGDAQHITNYTTTAELLRRQGYFTSAIGKWDVGYVVKQTTPTWKGFDSFLGYYKACNDDLFYHTTSKCSGETTTPTDMSRNVGFDTAPETDVNGTYSTRLFAAEAVAVLKAHFGSRDEHRQLQPPPPLYMYVAPQNVHLACGTKASKGVEGIQAPCSTVSMFSRVANDTFKGQTAVTAELDFLVGNITATLRSLGQWDNTVIIFTSDNGGPLDHTTNWPLRGGKHSFWDGGVRVVAGIGGGAVPPSRRGTVWGGLSHSADWYRTIVEGMAGGEVPKEGTGPVPDDSFELWGAILEGANSPRSEIVHQVSNRYFSENVVAMRRGDWKLIVGNPGDARTLRWPELSDVDVAFGTTGGMTRDNGTSCLSGIVTGQEQDHSHACLPGCLFNIADDPAEAVNLYDRPEHVELIHSMRATLKAAGDAAPPPSSYWSDPEPGLQRICAAMTATGYLEPVEESVFPSR